MRNKGAWLGRAYLEVHGRVTASLAILRVLDRVAWKAARRAFAHALKGLKQRPGLELHACMHVAHPPVYLGAQVRGEDKDNVVLNERYLACSLGGVGHDGLAAKGLDLRLSTACQGLTSVTAGSGRSNLGRLGSGCYLFSLSLCLFDLFCFSFRLFLLLCYFLGLSLCLCLCLLSCLFRCLFRSLFCSLALSFGFGLPGALGLCVCRCLGICLSLCYRRVNFGEPVIASWGRCYQKVLQSHGPFQPPRPPPAWVALPWLSFA